MGILQARTELPPSVPGNRHTPRVEANIAAIRQAQTENTGEWCLIDTFNHLDSAKNAATTTYPRFFPGEPVEMTGRRVDGAYGLWIRWPTEETDRD